MGKSKSTIACRRFVHGRPISSELELANYVRIPPRPRRNWILNRIYQSGPTRSPRRSTRHTPIFDPCQKLRGRFATHGFRRVVKLGEQPSPSLSLCILLSPYVPPPFHCLRLSAGFFSLSLFNHFPRIGWSSWVAFVRGLG